MNLAATAWALGAAFFFGLALVLTQFGLRWLPPLRGAVVSIPTTAVFFWLLAPLFLDAGAWHAGAVTIFAAIGFLFPALVTFLTFEANRRMGPNVAGALGNLAPLFAVAIAIPVLGELPRSSQILAILIIVAGISLLSLGHRAGRTSWPTWVLAVPLAAAAIRGLVQPAVKLGLALWPSPFAAALTGYTVSSLVVLSLAIMQAGRWPHGFPLKGVAWFAGVGLANGLAVLTMYLALAEGSVALVSPLVATYPLATLGLSWLLLHDVRLRPQLVMAIILMVGGVGLLLAA